MSPRRSAVSVDADSGGGSVAAVRSAVDGSSAPGPAAGSAAAPATRGTARPVGAIPAGVTVTGSTLRSASVERDDGDLIGSYVLTEPALDLLHRIALVIGAGRTGAWSVTGAYGTGKSSFAVLLAALLAPHSSGTSRGRSAGGSHEQALELVARSDPALGAALREASSARPMLRALITARREPVGTTVVRALRAACTRRWGQRPPASVARALAALDDRDTANQDLDSGAAPGPGASEVLHAVRTVATAAPLLIVIDEFGKNLEYFGGRAADADAGADLYLLQELAELADAGAARGPALYLLTLQHASFLDYAAHTEALQRREWSKIQGRFQEVSFAAGPGDAAALIAGSLDQGQVSPSDATRLKDYGRSAATRTVEHGLNAVVVTDPDVLQASYPLHPLTLAALPLLAGALGQHDRTLGGFVAGDEPHGVMRFLTSPHAVVSAAAGATEYGNEGEEGAATLPALRTLQLPALWDYFATAVRGPALASGQASRWIEIETRLSEAHGLPDLDARILKTIAVLNLIDSSGCLRAGRDNIVFALTDPQQPLDGPDGAIEIAGRLAELTELGFVTYRSFCDEYRMWRGSSIDLPARLQAARDELSDHDVAALVQRSYAPAAVVAGRHSQTTGMLRHFQARVSDGSGTAVDTVPVLGPADGTIVFHLGDHHSVPALNTARPVLLGVSPDAEQVVNAGREVAALDGLRDTDTLDAPARIEIDERLSVARSDLAAALAAAFRPDRSDVVWQLRLAAPEAAASTHEVPAAPAMTEVTEVAGVRSLSALVSAACDRAYPQSPHVRNEMLGRHQLTSQGAKARRELLAALLEHPDAERVAISGHGPDRAMYDGVVEFLGLHGATDQSPTGYGWTTPTTGHPASPAWIAALKLLRSAHDAVSVETFYTTLSAPPFGVKSGVIPLLLVSALVHTADDVAIFDDGSFIPRLSADHVERMVKTPARFTMRFVPAGRGQRRELLDTLHDALLGQHGRTAPTRTRRVRNSSLIKVVTALLDVARGLSSYAKATKELPDAARAVREALTTSRDPAELVFAALPAAIGYPPVNISAPADPQRTASLTTDLLDAVDALKIADRRLADWASEQISDAFHVAGDIPTMRQDLAARARIVRGGLTSPTLSAFLDHAQREDPADDDWLTSAILILTGRPLVSWRDSDVEAFPNAARQLARTFARVYELYFDANRPAGAPFHARRVTLTRPDGTEHHVVVGLPETHTAELTVLLDELLERTQQIQGLSGSASGHTVLAALAERLLGTDESQADATINGELPQHSAAGPSSGPRPVEVNSPTPSPARRRRSS